MATRLVVIMDDEEHHTMKVHAYINRMNISEYIRELIRKDMKQAQTKKEKE